MGDVYQTLRLLRVELRLFGAAPALDLVRAFGPGRQLGPDALCTFQRQRYVRGRRLDKVLRQAVVGGKEAETRRDVRTEIDIIENVDVGGSPRYGESDITGEIIVTLGEGNWYIKISNNRVAGYDCYNEGPFVIEAGMTTFLCLDVNCE